jgi:hypothetical protein
MTTSWRELNKKGLTFTEDELNEMLQQEIARFKRVSILKRLHQRLGVVRQQREWNSILEMIK